MARKKVLAVNEYEILENGVIIMREETHKYFIDPGVGKTFAGEHYYYEETIALARRYGDEETYDCEDSECCDPSTSLEDLVSGFYPKGEAVKARRKHQEEVRLGITQVSQSRQGDCSSPLMRKRLDALGKALGSAMAEDLEDLEEFERFVFGHRGE